MASSHPGTTVTVIRRDILASIGKIHKPAPKLLLANGFSALAVQPQP